MAQLSASAEAPINAPAEQVYLYIADFREHHHRFLPPAFSNFVVEEGGVGAGTVSRFTVTLGGRPRTTRTVVTEPEPGRVLAETDLERGAVTSFTVMPDGARSRVRIQTVWEAAEGIEGLFERFVAPYLLGRLYRDELQRLDEYALQQSEHVRN